MTTYSQRAPFYNAISTVNCGCIMSLRQADELLRYLFILAFLICLPVALVFIILPARPSLGSASGGVVTMLTLHAYLTVKVKAVELPPAGAGLFTRRFAVREVTRSAAGIATRSCPELTNTVVRAEPLQSAIDPGTKFDPVIVTQVLLPGETTLAGNNAEMEGTGFGADDGGRTKDPRSKTTRPLPLPQKSFAVRNPRPSCPHRMRSKASPVRLSN